MFQDYSANLAQIFGLKEKRMNFSQKVSQHPGSPNGLFTKETDIMDVWFDSGSSHQGVLSNVMICNALQIYIWKGLTSIVGGLTHH